MNNRFFVSAIIATFSICTFILAGCSNSTPTPAQVEKDTRMETLVAVSTQPKQPTRTTSPTQVPTRSASSTSTIFATTVPESTTQPPDNWGGATFFTAGFLPDWNFFIAVQLKEEIEGQYYAVVDEGKTYYCSNSYYPHRLYCTGRIPQIDKWVKYTIFDNINNQPVFSGEVFVPLDQQNAIPVFKRK